MVTVQEAVPGWLTALVAAARAVGASVVIEAEAPSDLAGESLAGWEIGVCTASLGAGAAEVTGISPHRVARVREVDALLAAAARRATPETAP